MQFKRVDLIRHLEGHGCRLLREGGSHSVYVNDGARKVLTVPRHTLRLLELAEREPESFLRTVRSSSPYVSRRLNMARKSGRRATRGTKGDARK